MIYRILIGFYCLCGLMVQAQVLRDMNYSYKYDPARAFTFTWKVLKLEEGFRVCYELSPTDSTRRSDFTLQFETRGSLSEKNGNPITSSGNFAGATDFKVEPDQLIIVAKVTRPVAGKPKVFIFHQQLPKTKSIYLNTGQSTVLNSYVNIQMPLNFSGFNSSKPVQINYYGNSFPAAAPPFATTQAKVSKLLKPDSLFSADASSSITFSKKGMYLAQQDTSSADGIAFRVEDDYPKLGKIETLMAPLIYICTRQEAEKLKQVGDNKKKFDQFILSLTGNQERARIFMRSYFKQVELANQYFSSYKEGWKTDRGMILIIYGAPEEVYLFDDREVWEYNKANTKIRFQFVKSPTLFDPNNYVLIREKKFNNSWLDMVDLWRKARF